LNGQDIPFANSVKYIGVIFDEKITGRLHIETIEAKAFRTFIGIYPLFKSEQLSTNVKFTLHKALIRSAMTYACPACEFVAETHLLILQRLRDRVLRNVGNFPKRTSVHDILVAFRIPYVYYYVPKLFRKQAEIIKSHEN
jgi:hypothetical protein